MTPLGIISQIKTQLSASDDLSYVKEFLVGITDKITMFPTVYVDYLGTDEDDITYNKQELRMHVAVVGIINNQDREDQVTANTSTVKGILRLENDIKKAISSDPTFSGNAVHTRIIESRSEPSHPTRSISIELEVLFRQNSQTRS